MAIEFPHELDWLAEALGGQAFPQGDEDRLRAVGQHWQGLGGELGDLADQVRVLGGQVAQGVTGPAGDAYQRYLDEELHRVLQSSEVVGELGQAAREAALQTEHAKIMIIMMLVVVAAQIVWLLCSLFGAAAVPAVEAAAQYTLRAILQTLATRIVADAAIGAVLMVVMDSIAQGIEMARGDRTRFDAGSLVGDLETGAIAGAAAGAATAAAEVFLPSVMDGSIAADLTGRLSGRAGVDLGADSAGDLAVEAAADSAGDLAQGAGRDAVVQAMPGLQAAVDGVSATVARDTAADTTSIAGRGAASGADLAAGAEAGTEAAAAAAAAGEVRAVSAPERVASVFAHMAAGAAGGALGTELTNLATGGDSGIGLAALSGAFIGGISKAHTDTQTGKALTETVQELNETPTATDLSAVHRLVDNVQGSAEIESAASPRGPEGPGPNDDPRPGPLSSLDDPAATLHPPADVIETNPEPLSADPALAVPAVEAAVQHTLRAILQTLATNIVAGAAIGAVLMVVMDSIAQGIEMVLGDRSRFDAGSLVGDLEMGAIAGAVTTAAEMFLPSVMDGSIAADLTGRFGSRAGVDLGADTMEGVGRKAAIDGISTSEPPDAARPTAPIQDSRLASAPPMESVAQAETAPQEVYGQFRPLVAGEPARADALRQADPQFAQAVQARDQTRPAAAPRGPENSGPLSTPGRSAVRDAYLADEQLAADPAAFQTRLDDLAPTLPQRLHSREMFETADTALHSSIHQAPPTSADQALVSYEALYAVQHQAPLDSAPPTEHATAPAHLQSSWQRGVIPRENGQTGNLLSHGGARYAELSISGDSDCFPTALIASAREQGLAGLLPLHADDASTLRAMASSRLAQALSNRSGAAADIRTFLADDTAQAQVAELLHRESPSLPEEARSWLERGAKAPVPEPVVDFALRRLIENRDLWNTEAGDYAPVLISDLLGLHVVAMQHNGDVLGIAGQGTTPIRVAYNRDLANQEAGTHYTALRPLDRASHHGENGSGLASSAPPEPSPQHSTDPQTALSLPKYFSTPLPDGTYDHAFGLRSRLDRLGDVPLNEQNHSGQADLVASSLPPNHPLRRPLYDAVLEQLRLPGGTQAFFQRTAGRDGLELRINADGRTHPVRLSLDLGDPSAMRQAHDTELTARELTWTIANPADAGQEDSAVAKDGTATSLSGTVGGNLTEPLNAYASAHTPGQSPITLDVVLGATLSSAASQSISNKRISTLNPTGPSGRAVFFDTDARLKVDLPAEDTTPAIPGTPREPLRLQARIMVPEQETRPASIQSTSTEDYLGLPPRGPDDPAPALGREQRAAAVEHSVTVEPLAINGLGALRSETAQGIRNLDYPYSDALLSAADHLLHEQRLLLKHDATVSGGLFAAVEDHPGGDVVGYLQVVQRLRGARLVGPDPVPMARERQMYSMNQQTAEVTAGISGGVTVKITGGLPALGDGAPSGGLSGQFGVSAGLTDGFSGTTVTGSSHTATLTHPESVRYEAEYTAEVRIAEPNGSWTTVATGRLATTMRIPSDHRELFESGLRQAVGEPGPASAGNGFPNLPFAPPRGLVFLDTLSGGEKVLPATVGLVRDLVGREPGAKDWTVDEEVFVREQLRPFLDKEALVTGWLELFHGNGLRADFRVPGSGEITVSVTVRPMRDEFMAPVKSQMERASYSYYPSVYSGRSHSTSRTLSGIVSAQLAGTLKLADNRYRRETDNLAVGLQYSHTRARTITTTTTDQISAVEAVSNTEPALVQDFPIGLRVDVALEYKPATVSLLTRIRSDPGGLADGLTQTGLVIGLPAPPPMRPRVSSTAEEPRSAVSSMLIPARVRFVMPESFAGPTMDGRTASPVTVFRAGDVSDFAGRNPFALSAKPGPSHWRWPTTERAVMAPLDPRNLTDGIDLTPLKPDDVLFPVAGTRKVTATAEQMLRDLGAPGDLIRMVGDTLAAPNAPAGLLRGRPITLGWTEPGTVLDDRWVVTIESFPANVTSVGDPHEVTSTRRVTLKTPIKTEYRETREHRGGGNLNASGPAYGRGDRPADGQGDRAANGQADTLAGSGNLQRAWDRSRGEVGEFDPNLGRRAVAKQQRSFYQGDMVWRIRVLKQPGNRLSYVAPSVRLLRPLREEALIKVQGGLSLLRRGKQAVGDAAGDRGTPPKGVPARITSSIDPQAADPQTDRVIPMIPATATPGDRHVVPARPAIPALSYHEGLWPLEDGAPHLTLSGHPEPVVAGVVDLLKVHAPDFLEHYQVAGLPARLPIEGTAESPVQASTPPPGNSDVPRAELGLESLLTLVNLSDMVDVLLGPGLVVHGALPSAAGIRTVEILLRADRVTDGVGYKFQEPLGEQTLGFRGYHHENTDLGGSSRSRATVGGGNLAFDGPPRSGPMEPGRMTDAMGGLGVSATTNWGDNRSVTATRTFRDSRDVTGQVDRYTGRLDLTIEIRTGLDPNPLFYPVKLALSRFDAWRHPDPAGRVVVPLRESLRVLRDFAAGQVIPPVPDGAAAVEPVTGPGEPQIKMLKLDSFGLDGHEAVVAAVDPVKLRILHDEIRKLIPQRTRGQAALDLHQFSAPAFTRGLAAALGDGYGVPGPAAEMGLRISVGLANPEITGTVGGKAAAIDYGYMATNSGRSSGENVTVAVRMGLKGPLTNPGESVRISADGKDPRKADGALQGTLAASFGLDRTTSSSVGAKTMDRVEVYEHTTPALTVSADAVVSVKRGDRSATFLVRGLYELLLDPVLAARHGLLPHSGYRVASGVWLPSAAQSVEADARAIIPQQPVSGAHLLHVALDGNGRVRSASHGRALAVPEFNRLVLEPANLAPGPIVLMAQDVTAPGLGSISTAEILAMVTKRPVLAAAEGSDPPRWTVFRYAENRVTRTELPEGSDIEAAVAGVGP